MTRVSTQRGVGQRQRTADNPLFLGTFSETSLRFLHGTLEATYQVQSNGFGGGTYNHWFAIEITSPAWIILRKEGERSKYIQLSFYDLNFLPIEGRSIFQEDSVQGNFLFDEEDAVYFPYVGHAMGAQSSLYNSFQRYRLDRGDERYYPLGAGKYLICVSSTRNEPLTYDVGVVVEFPNEDLFVLLEDLDVGFIALEGGIDTANTTTIGPVLTADQTIDNGFNAFTEELAQIDPGVTITIAEGFTWFIGFVPAPGLVPDSLFLLDVTETFDFNSTHEHSRTEWVNAWEREHQQTDRFPSVFEPLLTRP